MAQPRPPPASFLNLPQELRDEIYTYIFCSSNTSPLNRMEVLRHWQSCPCTGRALLFTNNQLRSETLPLFYSNHNIQFLIGHRYTAQVINWIENTDERVISNIKLLHVRDADDIWVVNDCLVGRCVGFDFRSRDGRLKVWRYESYGGGWEGWDGWGLVKVDEGEEDDVGVEFDRRGGDGRVMLTRGKLRRCARSLQPDLLVYRLK